MAIMLLLIPYSLRDRVVYIYTYISLPIYTLEYDFTQDAYLTLPLSPGAIHISVLADNFFASFPSTAHAIRAALCVTRTLDRLNMDRPQDYQVLVTHTDTISLSLFLSFFFSFFLCFSVSLALFLLSKCLMQARLGGIGISCGSGVSSLGPELRGFAAFEAFQLGPGLTSSALLYIC